MLKKTLLTLSCICIVTAFNSFREEKKQKVLRTIIIDAGHGGKDQGASGLISTEAQLCLEMAKKLGKEIEQSVPGVKVLYTRTTDIIPGNKPDKNQGLRYRADFANQSGADLFISIHCNSAGKKPGGWYEKRIIDWNYKVSYVGKGRKRRKVKTKIPVYQPYYVVNETSGTETYIWTAKENSHKEQVVGVQDEFAGGESSEGITVPENDPVIQAMKLLYAKKYFKNSLRLADLVQTEFEKSGRINRGVKQRNEKGIWVLHATGMPSILIETGFISNKEEEEYLNSEKGQNEVVQNIT
ncbi:MAG: N-acetylmuramoyl-L-alanine amidase, partial [Chitinophagaceae bacterium]|nr:N-acetylmuramoyl-L-alanine amidase [Chitinophagaceae bacterium]